MDNTLHYGSLNSRHALVFLHGYDQMNDDMKQLLSMSISKVQLQAFSLVVFFPGSKWFDYKNNDSLDYEPCSLTHARNALHKLLYNMESKYDVVLIGGYSQGGCMAIDASLTYGQSEKKRYKRMPVLSICGFVMAKGCVHPGEHYDNIEDCTIFQYHGKRDKTIPIDTVRRAYLSCSRVVLKVDDVDHWGFWDQKALKCLIHQFLKESLVRRSVRLTHTSQVNTPG